MRSLYQSLAVVSITAALIPGVASGQRAASGAGIGVSAMVPDSRLGGGTLTGPVGTVTLGLTARTSLELSLAGYQGSNTETYTGGSERHYRLLVPAATLRIPIYGETNELSLLIGGGAFRYNLSAGASGISPSATETRPVLNPGLALKLPIVGPLVADLSVRDWIGYDRIGELTAAPGKRGMSNSPEARLTFSLLFRHHSPSIGSNEVAPDAGMIPVNVSAVRDQNLAVTGGRDHMHTDQGQAVDVKAVDMREFTGEASPTGVSILVPTGPSDLYDDRLVGTIYFALGSSVVETPYRTVLADVAAYLRAHPTATLYLNGYADPADGEGSNRPNLLLAERRGTDVQALLARLYAIPSGRMVTTSYGVDYIAKHPQAARRTDLVVRLPKP